MIEEGRLRTCDICGASIFSKLIKTEISDGGYGDEIRRYEKNDAGWESIEIPCRIRDNIVGKHRDLCPECLNKYYELATKFVNGKGRFENDQSS